MSEQPQHREWKPGDTVGPQDFGITPAAPNPLSEAMRRDLAHTAEEMSALADPKSPSMKLWHTLLGRGVSEDEATVLMNGYAHELAERQRRDHNIGGGCSLGVCHGESMPDIIDPEVDYDGENVQPVRPGEEPTP